MVEMSIINLSTNLWVSGYYFQKNIVFFCLKIFFSFTDSVDPDEMKHYAAFHLGFHCLQKYRMYLNNSMGIFKNYSHLH